MASGWIKATCIEPGKPDRIVYQRVVDDAVISYHEEDGSEFTPSPGGSMRALGYGAGPDGRHSPQTDAPSAKPPFDTKAIDAAEAERLKAVPEISDAPAPAEPAPPPPVVTKPDEQKP